MNSVEIFREGQIDGKQFLIFTSSSFSGDNDCPLFVCPTFRLEVLQMKAEKNKVDPSFLPLDVPTNFPHQQPDDLLHRNNCKLPLLPIFWCNNKTSSVNEFFCRACQSSELGVSYYFCIPCGDKFHKECVEAPLIIKHPSYPSLSHSLQLYKFPYSQAKECDICLKHDINGMSYYCPTNNLTMHPVCARKPILIFIDHPKMHPHTLTFFPKQAFLPCNICGLIKELIPTYICFRCVFVVHQDCVYFPIVIKISRHHHRISLTYPLPSGTWTCGVCRQKVDNDFGAYFCNKCGDYFVHSRCALRRDLWDGQELEGATEELEVVIEPFKRIADGIILHFSHDHHLKLETIGVYVEDKFCQGCFLRVYEGNYYLCVDQCDFIIHEACANAPMKKYHPLHAHSLTLNVVSSRHEDDRGYFSCSACMRQSCGFSYENHVEKFSLDLSCASISEPFVYDGHEHPLYLALTPAEENSALCHICQKQGHTGNTGRKLNCIECNYIICFKCATLPYKAKYKHDEHFLTFYEAKKEKEHSEWCDVCEKKIADSKKKGFYSCEECCTTVHIDCLLGQDMYMKPGYVINYYRGVFHILPNNTLSRPKCFQCEYRCSQKVVFKNKSNVLCSEDCVSAFRFSRRFSFI